MNLVIDVGNSFSKIALVEKETILYKEKCVTSDLAIRCNELLMLHSIKKGIISSVGFLTDEQLASLKSTVSLMTLTHDTPVPFRNQYATPKTLGVDRIALMSAASQLFPTKNVLVIDLGTCITYDFLSKDNIYYGGGISPGVLMRYQAMHTFTSKLPLLTPDSRDAKLIGTSTNASMQTGALLGTAYEIDGFIDSYKKKYKDLTVILTGGDLHFLQNLIKNDIFAHPNFLLKGLNYILEYNKF